MMMWPWMYYMQNMGQVNQGNRWGPQQFNGQPASSQQEKPVEPPKPSNKPGISCRIISDIDEVKPGEIPMDGSVGVFVKSDLSCVFVKQWGSDGVLHTKSFTEDSEPPTSQPIRNDILEKIDARFKQIEEAICNLSQPATSGSSNGSNVSTKKPKNNLKTGVD